LSSEFAGIDYFGIPVAIFRGRKELVASPSFLQQSLYLPTHTLPTWGTGRGWLRVSANPRADTSLRDSNRHTFVDLHPAGWLYL